MGLNSEESRSTVATTKDPVDKSETSPRFRRGFLLNRDIVWARLAPADLVALQWWLRRLVTCSNVMRVYFSLIDPTRERFPVTSARLPLLPWR